MSAEILPELALLGEDICNQVKGKSQCGGETE
jgi:hypothetical protein